jgi:hypothetical protein
MYKLFKILYQIQLKKHVIISYSKLEPFIHLPITFLLPTNGIKEFFNSGFMLKLYIVLKYSVKKTVIFGSTTNSRMFHNLTLESTPVLYPTTKNTNWSSVVHQTANITLVQIWCSVTWFSERVKQKLAIFI